MRRKHSVHSIQCSARQDHWGWWYHSHTLQGGLPLPSHHGSLLEESTQFSLVAVWPSETEEGAHSSETQGEAVLPLSLCDGSGSPDDLWIAFEVSLPFSWMITHVNSLPSFCPIFSVSLGPSWQCFCRYNPISDASFCGVGWLNPWFTPILMAFSNGSSATPSVSSEHASSFFLQYG